MSMIGPGALLALFAAVLCPAAPTALSELPGELFPLTTLVISALSNPAPGIVLAAEVTHDDAGPVLHISTVISHRKLLHEGEDVKIVWQEVLFLVFLWSQ